MLNQIRKFGMILGAKCFYRRSSCRRSTTYHRRLQFEHCEDRCMLATFSVTNVNDGVVTDFGDQPGTLRQAIFDANETPGTDTIDFDPAVFNTPTTINLTLGPLFITESVTIDATDGMGNLRNITITAAANSGIFNITDFTESAKLVTLVGLTLTGGNTSGTGGAIFSAEQLVLRDSVIHNNFAGAGGAIYMDAANAGPTPRELLRIENSVIRDNTSGGNGGGVFIDTPSILTPTADTFLITGSTFTNNQTLDFGSVGGGLYARFRGAPDSVPQLTITGTEFTSNRADRAGGGVFALIQQHASVTITDSLITGNAGSSGGGIFAHFALAA